VCGLSVDWRAKLTPDRRSKNGGFLCARMRG
jgi:hypothetical protein